MIWKIGLGMLFAGIVLTVGGIYLFGTAVSKATGARQVSNLHLEPGQQNVLSNLRVDPDHPVRLRIEAEIEVPQDLLDTAVDRAKIVEFSSPINYRVTDPSGDPVHLGAGTLRATEIIPDRNGPHYDSYDRQVALVHESDRFPAPAGGRIGLLVELPQRTELGAEIVSASLHLFDRAEEPAGWAAGGTASVLLGPVLGFFGLLVWIVGLVLRPKRDRL